MAEDIRFMEMDERANELLRELLYDKDGNFNLLSYNELKLIPFTYLRAFMHTEAIYSLPTKEAVEYLDNLIGDETAIGICSGRAIWEKELGMIATDSKIQQYDKNVIEYYNILQQPLIKYPDYVERIDANKAVIKYKPHTVFGSYVTPKKTILNPNGNGYGPVEEDLMKHCQRYIKIGSVGCHGDYSLCKRPHKRIVIPELITRTFNNDSCIFIWEN